MKRQDEDLVMKGKELIRSRDRQTKVGLSVEGSHQTRSRASYSTCGLTLSDPYSTAMLI